MWRALQTYVLNDKLLSDFNLIKSMHFHDYICSTCNMCGVVFVKYN
jgi:hypothetical protein